MILFLFLIFPYFCHPVFCSEDFYEVLGVNKKSSADEIKKAFKFLAKEHHSIKYRKTLYSHNLAMLNLAYQTLSDEKKRSLYDVFKVSSVDLDLFLSGNVSLEGDSFQLQTSNKRGPVEFKIIGVTTEVYDKEIKSSSHKQPYLIFVSSRQCEDCDLMVQLWHEWCRKLFKDGVKCGVMIKDDEVTLMRRLRAPSSSSTSSSSSSSSPPSLVGIIRGKSKWLTSFPESYEELISFAVQLFPEDLVMEVNDLTHLTYFQRCIDDKNNVIMLLFVNGLNPPLSFYTSLFNTRSHVSGAFVQIKNLCVILLTNKRLELHDHLSTFKQYSDNYLHRDRVRFAYLLEETQRTFVQLLTWGRSYYNETANSLKVVIMWRKDAKTLNYDLLEDGWFGRVSNQLRARRKLNQHLEWLLTNPTTLANVVELRGEIVNEHLKNIWYRVGMRLQQWNDGIVDFFLGIDDATYMMMLKTLVIIFLFGLGIGYLVHREYQMVQSQSSSSSSSSSSSLARPDRQKNGMKEDRPTIYIYLLGSENYHQLLVESASNMRLILLLVDKNSKDRLVQYFGSYLQPYARSSAFRFAILDLNNYFGWYKQLLDITMRVSEHYNMLKRNMNNINVKNCLGQLVFILRN
ncbi:hypothetical protein HELRODRAFT_159956 [Helobdella robusta]|uniref:J domain-containing protein n=1 Tax=Helobdella robusta TaxID=6412 RepID=T1EPL4_HELRO|nr:hypothetical protein HELRODRAFT_159956 [Helobdella robusta]ESO05876.1 hypothetical protein HELRODRAFT_159956 [Helobdella robusta]